MKRGKKKEGSFIVMKPGAFEEKYILSDVILGAGNYAQVKLGTNKETNEQVAVKILNKSEMKPRDVKIVEREVKILKKLSHKNVVKVFDAFYDASAGVYFIVMEYCENGDLLKQIVDEKKEFTEDDVRDIIRTICNGLKYCKESGIIHRDIKPDNILIDDRGNLKIADFNLSKVLSKYEIQFTIIETRCGTPNYVAPEVLSGKPYNFKCDIWSVGVILFVLLSGGYLPFYPDDDEAPDALQNLIHKVHAAKWTFEPEEAWVGVSTSAKDLVSRMMKRSPNARIGYEEILGHPWLKQVEKPKGHLKHTINTSSLSQLQKKVDKMRNLRSTNTTLAAVSLMRDMMLGDGNDDDNEKNKSELPGVSFGGI